MITDEMIDTARDAFSDYADYPEYKPMRAALEVVAPALIADYQQSLNKLGEAYDKKCEEIEALRAENNTLRNFAVVAEERMETLTDELAKRQELDPQ